MSRRLDEQGWTLPLRLFAVWMGMWAIGALLSPDDEPVSDLGGDD